MDTTKTNEILPGTVMPIYMSWSIFQWALEMASLFSHDKGFNKHSLNALLVCVQLIGHLLVLLELSATTFHGFILEVSSH